MRKTKHKVDALKFVRYDLNAHLKAQAARINRRVAKEGKDDIKCKAQERQCKSRDRQCSYRRYREKSHQASRLHSI